VHPAQAALLAGENDRVLRFLERSYADEDPDLDFMIRYPAFDPIRSEPGYAVLRIQLGLPQSTCFDIEPIGPQAATDTPAPSPLFRVESSFFPILLPPASFVPR
jgi:hypothetical protein